VVIKRQTISEKKKHLASKSSNQIKRVKIVIEKLRVAP